MSGTWKRGKRAEYRRLNARKNRLDRMARFCGPEHRKSRLLYLMERHEGRCALCGEECTVSFAQVPNQATVDHVIPISRGGLDEPSNWQLCCYSCNQRKGNSMPESVRT